MRRPSAWRLTRSTRAAAALRLAAPMIRSPSQCPASLRSPTAAGRSLSGRYWPSGPAFSWWRLRGRRRRCARGRSAHASAPSPQPLYAARQIVSAHTRCPPAAISALIACGDQRWFILAFTCAASTGSASSLHARGRRAWRPASACAAAASYTVLGAAAAAQLAIDRRRVPAQHHRDVLNGRSRRSHRLNPGALERAQPRCHMGHLHWWLLCRTTGHHDRSLATTGGVRRSSTADARGAVTPLKIRAVVDEAMHSAVICVELPPEGDVHTSRRVCLPALSSTGRAHTRRGRLPGVLVWHASLRTAARRRGS